MNDDAADAAPEDGRGRAHEEPAGDSAGDSTGDHAREGRDDSAEEASRRRVWRQRVAEEEETIARRLAAQWALMRDERRTPPAPIPVAGGPSNFTRAQVPFGVDLAASWAWRFIVIVAAGGLIVWTIGYLSVITLPLVIALFIAALATPVVALLERIGLRRGIGAIFVVIGGVALVGALLTFAGQQVATGATDLADQTVKGLGEIKTWLKDGPLKASDSQINGYIEQAQRTITEQSREGGVVTRLTEVGTAVGHVFAGFFIVLFATYFFLADGSRIWAFVVRIAPRAARAKVDSSGRVAWISLTQFVRATVIVAAVDAIGIMIVAAILQVPFVLAIGVLIFIGAFIPLVGATVTGSVAILVALVDQGPVTALLMLAGVVLVQQIEAHILQPFLMGRWVSVHPLAVILAIGCGVLIAGIAGALVAVPLVAAGNAVVQHLAASTAVGDDDPVDGLEDDYEQTGREPVEPDRADPEGTA